MRAIIQHRYGGFERLEYREDVAEPRPRRGEVAIAVAAASVNPADRFRVSGAPRLGRLAFGWFRPRVPGLGMDVAGTVVSLGPGVTRFAVGDEVYGETLGSFAEVVCAREDRVAARPRGLTMPEAAALPLAGVTALQAMRAGRARAGAHVLILGASGGVGHLAIQIARALDAEVTAVCSERNVGLVRSLGAHHAIDYTRDDFTAHSTRYDAILDLVGTTPIGRCVAHLSERGVYLASVGRTGWILRAALRSLVSRRVKVLAAISCASDLDALRELVDAGAVRPVIDRRFALEGVPDALRYSATERTRGKSVIEITAPRRARASLGSPIESEADPRAARR